MTSQQQQTISQLSRLMEKHFAADSSGHDYWHTLRVYQMALVLAKQLKAKKPDVFVISLAALAHDYTDWKFEKSQKSGDQKLVKLFTDLGIDQLISQKAIDIIHQISFKGAGVDTPVTSIEAAIVQDSDRLDAIGAIGIARAFAFGGAMGSPIYDPKIKPIMHASFQSYKKSRGTTINHFYEKLLLLKDRLHTTPAKKIASHRHKFMEKYLNTFLAECEQKAWWYGKIFAWSERVISSAG